MVDAIHLPSPHTDDATVFDGDVETVAVGVQHRRGLHPAVDVIRFEAIGKVGVHPVRPRLARPIGCAGSPRLGNAVTARHRTPWTGWDAVTR